jgi:2OG-Fe(II) oxygenase superfamily
MTATATPMPGLQLADGELESMLLNRRWVMRPKPFRYVIARDVFTPPVYARLEQAYQGVLDRTAGSAYLQKHDIHGGGLSPADAENFAPLLSRQWHDMIASIFEVDATGHVIAGIHHHRIGSANGAPHTDVNPGWFNDGPPQAPALEFANPDAVEYTSGKALSDDATPHRTMRAVALLYYIANPPWTAGDGGETGLYRARGDNVDRPVMRIPPINNSLFAFECTPRSWHGFISNRVRERNTVIMWLHRTHEDAAARWGVENFESYGGPRPSRGQGAAGPQTNVSGDGK